MRKSLQIIAAMGSMICASLISCNDNTKGEAGSPAPSDKSVKADSSISRDDLIKRGEYLVGIMGCDDCHSPKTFGPKGPEIDMAVRFSGYPSQRPLGKLSPNVIKDGWALFNGDLTAAAGPWGLTYAANISSDETGIGNWTEEQFKKALTQGKYKGLDNTRPLLPPMPWTNYKNLTNEDVSAIFNFLKTTTPVKNIVPMPKSPQEL